MGDKEIQWHLAFIAAMNLELTDNRSDLIFEPEHNLNIGALRIDLLIKRNGTTPFINEIGNLFREHNIIEYKSPDDHLDVDAFYKTIAYACLYKSYGEKSDSRPADDITITLIREAKPKKLFQYLKKHNIRVENPYHGIYYVLDMVLFPTQIIVTSELDIENHRWLCALSPKLKEQTLYDLLTDISRLQEKMEQEYADSVLEVALKANRELIERIRGDEKMSRTLLEIMEPVLQEREEKLRKESLQEGRQEGRQEGMVYAYYEMNLQAREIAQKLQLTEDEVSEIIQKMNEQSES